MKFDTLTAAQYAGEKLDSLLERAQRDTAEAFTASNIPIAVTYYAELRDTIKALQEKMSALQGHLDDISKGLLPTLFTNQRAKTITVKDIGRVSIKEPWTASILNKELGFNWLYQTGNQGLIIETVNAQTLGAFAKAEALAKRPLPPDLFKISASPHTSITKV